MRLPQDLANLLAVTIRDVVWYKSAVCSLLEECGVPDALTVEARRMRDDGSPTVKIVHRVLEGLAGRGDDGYQAVRKLLTRMYYWNDLQSTPADRREVALNSLRTLQAAYRRHQSQLQHQAEQEQKTHTERVARTSVGPVDHTTLQSFRDEFDGISRLPDAQARGNRFQDLLNRIFDYYCEDSRGAFSRTGEQIDGLFYFDKHWYYVEVRWRADRASAADISVLRDRAKSGYGGDTKALLISFNGFSRDCLDSLAGTRDERVILMDGFDLRCVLDCQVPFDILLAEKQAELVQHMRPFVGAGEIIARRLGVPPG